MIKAKFWLYNHDASQIESCRWLSRTRENKWETS